MKLTIEFEREDDGRWIAEVMELPGVMVYGSTKEIARRKVERLAVLVVVDCIKHGDPVPGVGIMSFKERTAKQAAKRHKRAA